ncbi:hypothetical protein [Rhizobium leguminosarum]|uniref:Uncharacterized protein n=1 Tax=Rhizobium leguminosarum TaxID=384 RepID=A0A6P0DGN6_RHILE|nr:hypothetical protein [Rhizobium leguminosarum]NEK52234.1 hypothetical protein [Rhizobium leguminosarum]WFT86833.1 hypothetical protein QA638_04230 [Rhizobium leguminosarum]
MPSGIGFYYRALPGREAGTEVYYYANTAKMLAKLIADWCDANSIDAGGDCAQAAYAAAVDLLSADTDLSADQLRQALDFRMAENKRAEPSS